MISEFVEYVKRVWKNKPNVSSPLNADSLNHMEDGIENNSKKIKETVTAVNELTENSAENAYQNMYRPGNDLDLLLVDTITVHGSANRPLAFSIEDASQIINSPITTGIFIGERIVHFLESKRLLVEIVEFYPNPGRHWYNHYNVGSWSGWRKVESVPI